MTNEMRFDTITLYSADLKRSETFYHDLLGVEKNFDHPNYVSFPLRQGVVLGLWNTASIENFDGGTAGGMEIDFSVGDSADVDRLCATWKGKGVHIVQEPNDAPYGRNFLALDPDGNRLRVIAPAPGMA